MKLNSILSAAACVATVFSRNVPERTIAKRAVLSPKVFIISLFAPEAAVWPGPLGLYANNVTVPGLSPLFPQAYCNAKGTICQVVTGEGEINAATSISAIVLSPSFDLTRTYFFVGGIAGINPACGTLGSVCLAKYVVQGGLEYEVDAREIPSNFSTGYVPLGAKAPNEYPVYLYGTEAFELNQALRARAYMVAKKAKLEDSDTAKAYRKKYPNAPANQPPKVFKGGVMTSDVYWHGQLLAEQFQDYFKLLSNQSGIYCMTAQEDNASLEALVRGALAKLVDFSRIIVMRTAANFDRPPPGETAFQQLLYVDSGGFDISVNNIYNAGKYIVQDIIKNWDSIYEAGIKPPNYVGDVFQSLNDGHKPDIGNPYRQTG